jgi:AcrR family transcriptional regulator
MEATQRRYGGKTAEERQAERRARLLVAGFELFGTRGYAATTIPAICTEAGLATRYFYEHFDSREDLFLALYDDLAGRVREAVETAVTAAPRDVTELTEAGVDAALRAYDDERVARIVLLEITRVSDRAEEHRRAALGAFAALSEEAIRAATGLPKRRARVVAIALVGAIAELLVHRAGDPSSIRPADLKAGVVALVEGALAARPAT